MSRIFAIACLAGLWGPLASLAQAGASQARLEDDCLQRLRAIVARDVKVSRVGFSALGNYATYYVVTYQFTGDLANGKRAAACTYRRDGQWVRDDAAAWQAARDLEPARRRATAD